MNTLLDSSEQHIAEMMINGTTMGIIDMTKKLNELEQPKAKEKRNCRRIYRKQSGLH